MSGRIIYPVNAGVDSSTVVSDYSNKAIEFDNARAFTSVSVNPLLKSVDIEDENSTATTTFTDSTCDYAAGATTIAHNANSSIIIGLQVTGTGIPVNSYIVSITDSTNFVINAPTTNGSTITNGTLTFSKFISSVIFTEIRSSSNNVGISNDYVDKIGNRILPTTNDITDSCSTNVTSPSYKIKIYNPNTDAIDAEVNRKLTYAINSDYPASTTLGIDIDNYDYFILLNPNIVTAGEDTVRAHFAKITNIIAFDEFGDGLEFSPKYSSKVLKGTKFEIFKGPAKTDTSVVAVSYGLRGDATASTPKYDTINIVSRPTFYFYNDRLNVKNQLDYSEKYTLTSTRWWGYSTLIATDAVTALAQWEAGSASKTFNMSEANYNKLIVGQSLFTSAGVFVGNIENKTLVGGVYKIYIDYARVAVNASSVATIYKIGKTHQNIVFKTESKFDNTIPTIGDNRLDALLVNEYDDIDTTDDSNNFNPIRWHTAFPNMKRHAGDLVAVVTNSENGLLTGPNKYLLFEKSTFQNDIVPNVGNSLLNKPRKALTQFARIEVSDSAGLTKVKLNQTGDSFKMRDAIYNSSFKWKTLDEPIEVSNSSSLLFTVSNMNKTIDLTAHLTVDDIVLIDNYYYVIRVLNAKATDTTQTFGIKAKRLSTSPTWTITTTVPTVDRKSLSISPISRSAYINFDFVSDTEVEHLRSNLITINSHSIDRTATRMYQTRLVSKNFPKHVNEIEFADKNNKYAKILDANKKYYQNTNISKLYYYSGAYVITDEVFTGTVENTTSEDTEDQGMKYIIEGRDTSANLLNKTISVNLKSTEDINYSSITPILNMTNHGSGATVSTSSLVVTVTGVASGTSDGLLSHIAKYGILANQNGVFIGEVSSASISSTTVTITLSHPTTLISEDITSIKYYGPFSNVYSNYISGLKMLGSNILHSNTTVNSSDIVEKSLTFDVGIDIDPTSYNNFTYSNLLHSSNEGSFGGNNSLGYDINGNKSISTGDSSFAFRIGNENGVGVVQNDITTINAETFDIIDTNIKNESNSTLTISPRFPMVLGRVEVNSLDTRGNCSIYLINNNINTGGIIHTLNNTNSNIYTPKESIRYWDIQKFAAGTLTRTSDTIYYTGKNPQKIQGYGVGYGVRIDGTPFVPTSTPTNLPINGSNTIDNWNYLETFYGLNQSNLIQSYALGTSSFTETNIQYDEFKQIDPRTIPFELMATGDIYPNSKLRWNNIGNEKHSNYNYDQFGILLESEEKGLTSITNHNNYDGKTTQTINSENNFEQNTIVETTQKPVELRRYGVIRLVEATFDWHFNPVDFESLKSVEEIPTVSYFDYVMMAKPTDLTDSLQITINGDADVDVVSSSSNATQTAGSLYYSQDFINLNDSDLSLIDTGSPNGFIAGRNSTAWSTATNASGNRANRGSSQIITANSLLKFDGKTNTTGYPTSEPIKYFGVIPFNIYRTTEHNVDNLNSGGNSSSGGILTSRKLRSHDIRFTNVFITSNEVCLDNFKFGKLSATGSKQYDAQNIILPIITGDKSLAGNSLTKDFSPYIHHDGWLTEADGTNTLGNRFLMHTSRVINALTHRKLHNTSTVTIADKYGLGISADNSTTETSHPYNNCIAVFKDLVDATNLNPVSIPKNTITSGPLTLDTITRYAAYRNATVATNTAFDQHTMNSMAQVYDSTTIFMGGTRVPKVFLEDKLNISSFTSFRHNNNTTNRGTVASAQMIVKPMFDLTAASNTLVFSNNNKTVTFTHKVNGVHSWLSFAPNLQGYYIVSEELTSGNSIRNQKDFGHPKFISKITSHIVSTAPSTTAIEAHTITFDTAVDVTANGTKYRLMRISETTFNGQVDEIAFNVLQHDNTAVNFTSLGKGDTDLEYQESVYTMFLLLNIDTANTFIESRTNTLVNSGFTDGEIINAHITDGITFHTTDITVSTTRKSLLNVTEEGLVWKFGGVLYGNGVVSVGEAFDVTLGTKPKLNNPTVCHIGTTFDVSANIDTTMQDIVEEADLEFDHSNTYIDETNNIVKDQGNNGTLGVHINKINCYSAIENVEVGDILYTEQARLVGIVASIGQGYGSSVNNMIVFTSLYYTPLQGDELVKIDKKTFTSSMKFENLNLLTALNALSSKKGVEYTIKNNAIHVRDFEDVRKLRKFSINYRESGRLLSVSNNESMFDKANKVTIIGDNISLSMDAPVRGSAKEIVHVDPQIKTKSDAEVAAIRILETHNTDALKITIKIQKKGLELVEAGDIVNLNFPNHGIPKGDYMIFEIENVLVGVLTITVGTFNKGIAERLSELHLAKSISDASTQLKNKITIVSGKTIIDDININEVSFGYTISSTATASNLGFDDSIGFTEVVGIERSTQDVEEFDSLHFYDHRVRSR
tara:strand:+ start:27607 stop:34719 length:7113 start_codon:yes stop_codon:yes gene_type:complete